jgi:glycosyltransferase involved in cell wall biosynthesis
MVDISVIMSVYNGERYLKEAIDSILSQSFKNYEFIIIDDGSTDSSQDIIRFYGDARINLIVQKNSGLSGALNKGIRAAKGRYIARMDADDISYSNRLEAQFAFLEANSHFVAVGSNADVMDMNGRDLYLSDLETDWERIKERLPFSPFFHSAVMMKRDAVIKAGFYNEVIKHYIEDALLWNQLSRQGNLGNLKDALIRYRLVPSSISNRNVKQAFEFRKIISEIVENGNVTNSHLLKLDRITYRKSHKWKMSNYYLRIGKIHIEKRFDRRMAFNNIIRSIYFNPLNKYSYFNLFLLGLPYRFIAFWKNSRRTATIF